MKKLFTLLTLALISIGSAWGSNTTLIDGITLPDVPSTTIDLSNQTDFTADSDGWIVFNPYASLGSKTYWSNNSGNKNGTTWSVPITAIAPFAGSASSTNAHTLRNNRTYALRFTGAEAISLLVKAASSTKKAIVSLYSYDGSKHTAVGAARECTSTDPTEIYINDLTTTTTYIAYIYSNNGDSNSYVMEIGLKAPAAPSTKTTINAATSDQTFIAYGNNCEETLSNSGIGTVTYTGIGTLTGTNMQGPGSNLTVNSTNYSSIKGAMGSTYVFTPASGITISAIQLYTTSNNSSSTCDITTGGVTTTTVNSGSRGTPTSIALVKNASGYFEFTVATTSAHGQNLFVLVITYDKAENIDVKVSSAEYATLFYDKNLTVPTGVTAYKAAVSGSNIVLTDIGDLIPANTGVILKGDAGKYNFMTTTADASGVDVSGNILTGVTSATAVSANTVYTLGQDNLGVVGLRLFSGTEVRAYCAYATSIAGARDFYNFSFEDETTGVNEVIGKKEEARGDFFDLQGRKIAQPTKGLYIMNGKKVIVK